MNYKDGEEEQLVDSFFPPPHQEKANFEFLNFDLEVGKADQARFEHACTRGGHSESSDPEHCYMRHISASTDCLLYQCGESWSPTEGDYVNTSHLEDA